MTADMLSVIAALGLALCPLLLPLLLCVLAWAIALIVVRVQ